MQDLRDNSCDLLTSDLRPTPITPRPLGQAQRGSSSSGTGREDGLRGCDVRAPGPFLLPRRPPLGHGVDKKGWEIQGNLRHLASRAPRARRQARSSPSTAVRSGVARAHFTSQEIGRICANTLRHYARLPL